MCGNTSIQFCIVLPPIGGFHKVSQGSRWWSTSELLTRLSFRGRKMKLHPNILIFKSTTDINERYFITLITVDLCCATMFSVTYGKTHIPRHDITLVYSWTCSFLGFGGAIIRASVFHLRLWVRSSHRTNDTYVKRVSQRSHPKSCVFSGYSSFFPQRMLTGWVGISPLTDPSTVAVLRDQTWVIRWLPGEPLESLRLDQVWAASFAIQLRSQLQVRIISTPRALTYRPLHAHDLLTELNPPL
jgi:hypothetical protein